MNRLKMIIPAVYLLSVGILTAKPFAAYAQLDKAKADLADIYNTYLTMQNVAFNLTYSYNSDTLNGDFSSEQIKGSYSISGKKSLYKLKDVTFMQNDSILIGVYDDQHVIIVGNPHASNATGALPSRSQLDSMLNQRGKDYEVAVTSKGKLTTISFIGIDSLAQFLKYDLVYDNSNHLIQRLQYLYRGITDKDLTDPSLTDSVRNVLRTQIRKKMLTVWFTDYRFDKAPDKLFDERNYIVYQGNIYKPAAAYAGYRIYNTKKE
jgi:hypothetical protein